MKKKKSKYEGLQKRKAISGYLFIAPFIIGFLMFMVKPMYHSFYMSFKTVELGGGTIGYSPATVDGEPNLFANYIHAFRVDPEFNQLLVEEASRMIIYSIAIIVFSFFVALILNSEFKGRALVRAVFFLPVILASGVMLGLESNNTVMANLAETIEASAGNISITAALEDILRTAGVGTRAFEKVFEVIDNIYDVAISSGIQIIIFLSGLQTVSSSLYEAADIDGCTKWESLWKITFPMVSSLFLVNWIYTVVDFSMRSDNKVIDKIQKVLLQLEYHHSSAMAWAYFAIVMAFVGITSFIISKVVYYND